MCFIERETQNLTLHLWREQCSGPIEIEWNLMKSQFFCQIYAIFKRKIGICCDWTSIFLYFWRVLKIFLNSRLSLIVPEATFLYTWLASMHKKSNFFFLYFLIFKTVKTWWESAIHHRHTSRANYFLLHVMLFFLHELIYIISLLKTRMPATKYISYPAVSASDTQYIRQWLTI